MLATELIFYTEKFHWLFVEGTRAMLTSWWAYGNISSLQHLTTTADSQARSSVVFVLHCHIIKEWDLAFRDEQVHHYVYLFNQLN